MSVLSKHLRKSDFQSNTQDHSIGLCCQDANTFCIQGTKTDQQSRQLQAKSQVFDVRLLFCFLFGKMSFEMVPKPQFMCRHWTSVTEHGAESVASFTHSGLSVAVAQKSMACYFVLGKAAFRASGGVKVNVEDTH